MSPSSTVLLDTTVLIDALRKRNRRRELLAALLASGHSLATSTFSIAEVYGGLRPGEWPGVAVPVLDPGADVGFEGLHALVHAAADHLGSLVAEPPFVG